MFESVIDPTRTGLDPDVFDCPDGCTRSCRLKSMIQRQILDIVHEFNFPVERILIKGSILSRQWLDDTDIDVLLIVTENISDDEYEQIKDVLKDHDKTRLAADTRHPFQFYAVRGQYDTTRADGLYDVQKDEWLLGPYDLSINVDDYLQDFEKAVTEIDVTQGELQRDIVDYEILRRLHDEDAVDMEGKLQGKIDEIDDSVEELIATYRELSDLRDNAFEQTLTPQEIREYGSKNALPANVIFKLLERYHYVNLMKQLKRTRKKHGPVDSVMDVERIKPIIHR
ncbi:MAG: hypothetical protein Q8K86_11545 [Candidatus Nanopelagicaceae bacterium]|nr:hypothetical protein [Candidatus Nanopelagicaceae bacterium]